MGKEKKKANPGILDWIADFFVNPIKNAITNTASALAALIIKPDVEAEKAATEILVEDMKKALAGLGGAHSPLTPEEAETELSAFAWKQVGEFIKIWMKHIGFEAASLGQVDVSMGEEWILPPLSTNKMLTDEIMGLPTRTAFMPLMQRKILKEYTPLLPGYADMISIYVREGYLAEKWVELPEEFAEYMKELGYSEDWTKRLWGKHWVLPGVELLYEMFGKKIIDFETLTMMLKFHDFEPVWRDRLIKNAYALIPRVDLRRAYMYRIPGFEDLTERYEMLRYSHDDAVTMDTIAKRFALTRYYTRLETVARAAFRKGRLTEDELREILVKVNTPEAAIDLIIEAENMARASAVREVAEEPSTPGRTDMRWMAEWGLIGLPELTGFLEADGMDPAWAPLVAETWMLNQLRDELGKVRGVYEDLLEEGFISKPDFEKALYSLHFAPHVVDALVRWADAKLDLDEKRELAKEYETLAKEEILTPTAYGEALRKLGMVEERITRKQHHIELLLGIKAAKEAAKA